MKDKQDLNKKQDLSEQKQEQEKEQEISLEDLKEVSGSAASPKPRERGSSKKSMGI